MNLPALFALAAAIGSPAAPPPPPPLVESEITAPGPSGRLNGVLLAPASHAKATVLIIPGSGPTDHDGDSAAGLTPHSYRLLAQALADRGVASIRIDKRGLNGSGGADVDGNAVTISDYAADARAWIAAARARTGARCVWLLGHSEGGLVALAAAAKTDGICGLVLLSTPGRPTAQLLREQLKANPANAPLLDQAMSAIDALEQGRHYDASRLHPALMALFRPQVQDFLIDEFRYDPAGMAAKTPLPVLIVQGDHDLQISVPADARQLAAAHPRARLVIVPDMNHVLKTVATADMAANFATYADPNLPLAPGLAEAISGFVLASWP